ncbi:MAG: glutathione S-transferase N-terminal domain-containing protein [Acetobacterium sp.]|nr:glutaredoxin domain-containing protein [uncultured Acetobacterium sp.]MBI4855963.1 glutathione S-transferase N-terminal domain-containing protein [Acetobacterium woodii]MBU4440208.1 glutathione S-transferase N-terminal domain-containing protein [Bacillota bacterium]MCG2730950.1 glutathione S-transferase N-terminal domain-containing protein [Acetobacterium sp.]
MKEIKLYTWAHCPYCRAARELLEEKGLKYTDIDIYNDEQTRRQLQDQTGHYTVPFVFIGETFIGGFSELKEIEFSGKLDELL